MTIELTFYHKTGVGASWDISAIKTDKMKEVCDFFSSSAQLEY